MPRYGTLFSRANRAVLILPSILRNSFFNSRKSLFSFLLNDFLTATTSFGALSSSNCLKFSAALKRKNSLMSPTCSLTPWSINSKTLSVNPCKKSLSCDTTITVPSNCLIAAFSLSFDDYIITSFNSGTLKTFPEYVYLSSKAGVPVEANVIGSAMFILALLIVIAGQFVGRRVKVSK